MAPAEILSTRTVMLRRVAEAAAATPKATLRAIALHAIEVASSSAPDRFHEADDHQARRHRGDAWAALIAASRPRREALALSPGRGHADDGAA